MVTEGPLTAAEIYEQITGGKGTQSLDAAQVSAQQLTERMVERAQRISALRAKTMSGWQGNAGEAAADATLPLVQAAADDSVHLENARTAVGAQMDAFGTAKHSVKPVAAQPPALGVDDVLRAISEKSWDSYHSKVAGWQADSQANIDAFSAYHSASTSNGGQMPSQYAQLADSGASVSLRDRTSEPTDTGEWARAPKETRIPAQDHVTGGNQDRATAQQNQLNQHDLQNQQPRPDQQNRIRPGTTSPSATNPGTTQPGTTNPDSTHANSYVPRPVMPAAQSGYEFGPTGQPVSNLTGPGTNYPGTSWPGGFGPGTDPYTGGGYPGPGATGPGTPGSTKGTGPNQPGTRPPGSSTGVRLPEERFPTNPARGSAGPRGANGLPMATPLAQRGSKEEDREKKKSPYLQNPDPDETFGGFTEKPMPPVIGEKKK